MVDFENGLFGEKALDFLANSDARLNILHGSVRSGKTINCSVRWIDYCMTGPAGDLVMMGKTFATLCRNVLNDIFDMVGPSNYRWVDRLRGELVLLDRRIYCYGAANEEAESKIRGATFAGALCDECNLYPKNVWNQLMARLSISGAKVFCNCNPDSPYHWFYTDYITNDEIKDKKIWHFTMDDNPNLDAQYVENLKLEYRGVWYDRMIKGLWVAADGLIYDMFEPSKHMVPVIPLLPRSSDGRMSPAIRWLVGCDYGTATVMSWGLYARVSVHGNSSPRYYKVSEYYYDAAKERRQMTDSEFANEFEKWLQRSLPDGLNYRYAVECVYCDPSAVSWKVELSRRGFRVLNADNDVINGIRVVATKLATCDYLIDSTCVNTQSEYANYQWDKNAQIQGVDKPVKFKDHTCLTSETEIWTLDGKRYIKDLVGLEGSCFCFDLKSKKFTLSRFSEVRKTSDSAKVLRITLAGEQVVRCTPEHEILTDNGWKEAGKLKYSDKVICSVSKKAKCASVYVENIEECPDAPVYDLTVDKYHNVLVNEGIVVHNCDTDRYVIYTDSQHALTGVY